MIHQQMPRRGYRDCVYPENKGFFIDGADLKDCINQLKEWCAKHPEKWVYYHDCGTAPGYPVPVARRILEVTFSDKEPTGILLFSVLFQKGSAGEREIDDMTEDERLDVLRKHLNFFYTLGTIARNNP